MKPRNPLSEDQAAKIAQAIMFANPAPAFTLAEGLALQVKNLAEWQAKLPAPAFTALQSACQSANSALAPEATGFDVMRGNALADFLRTYYPAPAPREFNPAIRPLRVGSDVASFLEAILFTYPEDEDGENPMDGKSVFDFSPEFIAAAESFIDGFREYLASLEIEVPDSPRSFGGNVYFSLSGHGCGFWDSDDTEHLQAPLETFSGSKYRFESIDLSEDEHGKLDLAILPEFLADYRRRLFDISAPAMPR